LFEQLKGSTVFAGLAAQRLLCTHPYFISCLYFSNLVAVLAGHLCEFHTKQWGESCSVPVSCLPHAFVQLIVCKSAVNCLNSWRAVLLSQDALVAGSRNLLTSGLDSGSSWLDGVNGVLMQQEPNSPKQDYWNWRAIASLANTLITVMEPVPMPLLSSMLLLQL
jgi:hypothetical protein